MTTTSFGRDLEQFRIKCANHFRNAGNQLKDNPLGKNLPLHQIADIIDGTEQGLDKRLVGRFNAIKERELARFGNDPSSGDQLDMLVIDIEHSQTRQEIIDTARQDMKLFGTTRYEAQDQLVMELEVLQQILGQPPALRK